MFGQHAPGTERNLVLLDGSHGERSVVLDTVMSIQGHNRRWQPQSATVMCLRGHAQRHTISGSLVRSGPGPAMSHYEAGSGQVRRGIRMGGATTESLQHSPDAIQVPDMGLCRSTLSTRRRHYRSMLAV